MIWNYGRKLLKKWYFFVCFGLFRLYFLRHFWENLRGFCGIFLIWNLLRVVCQLYFCQLINWEVSLLDGIILLSRISFRSIRDIMKFIFIIMKQSLCKRFLKYIMILNHRYCFWELSVWGKLALLKIYFANLWKKIINSNFCIFNCTPIPRLRPFRIIFLKICNQIEWKDSNNIVFR